VKARFQKWRDNGETPLGPAPYGDAAVTLPIFFENGKGEPAAVPFASLTCACGTGAGRTGAAPSGGASRSQTVGPQFWEPGANSTNLTLIKTGW